MARKLLFWDSSLALWETCPSPGCRRSVCTMCISSSGRSYWRLESQGQPSHYLHLEGGALMLSRWRPEPLTNTAVPRIPLPTQQGPS